MRRGVFPGSFDPPTRAHLAIADAARAQLELDTLHLVLSAEPLGKDASVQVPVERRAAALAALGEHRRWLQVEITHARLVAEVAAGYDAVVVGADKWEQILDVAWYPSAAARDRAVAALPTVGVVPRAGRRPPAAADGVVVLEVEPWVGEVSSTAVRAGRREWVLPEAAHLLGDTASS